MDKKCLFEYNPQLLEIDEFRLKYILGNENVYDWGKGQVAIHCPVEGCRAEMEADTSGNYDVADDYTLSSVQVARAQCLKRDSNG